MPSSLESVVSTWVDAWTYARGLAVTEVDGWPLVHVRSASRETELVCFSPTPDAAQRAMSTIAGDPRAMLTIIAADLTRYTSLDLPPGVRMDRDDECLMSARLSPVDSSPFDEPYVPRWVDDGLMMRYSLELGDQEVATGAVGVSGPYAAYDAVETIPAFQRSGLGHHVIATLTARAMERGAAHGVLAASAEGRRLYEKFGWQVDAPMWSLMGSPFGHATIEA